MKKFPIAVGLAFVFGLSALAGCAVTDGDSAKIKGEQDANLGSSENFSETAFIRQLREAGQMRTI